MQLCRLGDRRRPAISAATGCSGRAEQRGGTQLHVGLDVHRSGVGRRGADRGVIVYLGPAVVRGRQWMVAVPRQQHAARGTDCRGCFVLLVRHDGRRGSLRFRETLEEPADVAFGSRPHGVGVGHRDNGGSGLGGALQRARESCEAALRVATKRQRRRPSGDGASGRPLRKGRRVLGVGLQVRPRAVVAEAARRRVAHVREVRRVRGQVLQPLVVLKQVRRDQDGHALRRLAGTARGDDACRRPHVQAVGAFVALAAVRVARGADGPHLAVVDVVVIGAPLEVLRIKDAVERHVHGECRRQAPFEVEQVAVDRGGVGAVCALAQQRFRDGDEPLPVHLRVLFHYMLHAGIAQQGRGANTDVIGAVTFYIGTAAERGRVRRVAVARPLVVLRRRRRRRRDAQARLRLRRRALRGRLSRRRCRA
mmetsp:Transcript_37817/g.116852  ORF Transcript_37817/g.116852 Transcript_37817/m.116852 type:complete len:422 (+) Transcript_37817:491-1756(+)